MIILYDLQGALEPVKAGELAGMDLIEPVNEPFAALMVEQTEDVKSILVTDRSRRECGIGIRLSAVPGLQEGDRLTITGRVGQGAPPGATWSVALLSPVVDGHLTQHIAPSSLFALSHILEASEVDLTLIVHTIHWGVIVPLMDFYVDSILIFRREKSLEAQTDTRGLVYSMAEDHGVQWVGAEDTHAFSNTAYVSRAGEPMISIFRRGDTNVFYVGTRVHDWDGMDINIGRMGFIAGNLYRVTVTGRMDGPVPEGTLIMLQGIPDFSWCGQVKAGDDQEFTLTHTLTQSEVERWNTMRITTNSHGASVSFYVYSVEVNRIG